MTTEKDIARFNSKLVIQPNGCWEYSGAKDADGYGMFWFQGKTKGAHQFSARYLANLIINKGDQVCHTCDNPPCCNPDHLFIGSTQMNTADRHAKGRTVRGSDVGTSKYTESIIQSVKDAYNARPHYRGIIKDLSQEFNVSYGVVWYACRSRSWAHIS
jgi:hypothetical protein